MGQLDRPEHRLHGRVSSVLAGVPLPAVGTSPPLLQMLPRLFPTKAESICLRLGDLLIVGIPGEMTASLGLAVKAQAGVQREPAAAASLVLVRARRARYNFISASDAIVATPASRVGP